MGTENHHQKPSLSTRVAQLSQARRERIIEAAGVISVEEKNEKQPCSMSDWGFARLPSLDCFYKVRAGPTEVCHVRNLLPPFHAVKSAPFS